MRSGSFSDRPVAVDVFCGVGGLSLGFEQAGFDVAAAIDSNPRSTAVYSSNFPEALVSTMDVRNLTPAKIREIGGFRRGSIDVLIGGPPCQGFSHMGRREHADPRNQLVLEFVRLVRELEPAYFVMENVEGLLDGRMSSLLHEFDTRLATDGYRIQRPIQLLDSADFGVPQRRRRVFVVGGKMERALPLPVASGRYRTASVGDALSDLPSWPHPIETRRTSAFAREMRGELIGIDDHSIQRPFAASLSGYGETVHSQSVRERFDMVKPGGMDPISRFRRLDLDGLSPALRAGTMMDRGAHTAARPIHPLLPRCITVREAARLHSYPDWFAFDQTIWHGFHQIGNSVPPRLGHMVARSIMVALTSGKDADVKQRLARRLDSEDSARHIARASA